MEMTLTLRPRKVALAFFWIVMALTLINSVVLYFYFKLNDDSVYGLVGLFDFDTEGNIPTFYAATALLFCAMLLAVIARVNWREAGRWHWLGLAVLFVLLALDEGVGLHENLSNVFEGFMRAEGVLYFLWVVPYGIATVVIGLIYLRFVFGLPRITSALFIAAGTIFLTGAVGLEMLGAQEADQNSLYTVKYCVLYTFEELFEMLGIVLFIYALLSYIAGERISFVVKIPHGARSKSGANAAVVDDISVMLEK